MSADVVVYDDRVPTVVQQQASMQSMAVQRLGAWAESAIAAHEVASSLVQTSFVPQAFRGKPHEATAAILAGAEVGLSPMASLRSFDVIQGTAAARAMTLRAIVQSQGHEMILTESTATRAKMRGRRRGSDAWQEVVWTIDRARDLQLLGKDNWKKQPAAMLVARASSELARLIAADAILGIGYTVEELDDGADPQTQPTEAVETGGTRRMSLATISQPDEAEEHNPDDAQDVDATATLLNPQSALGRKMFALMNDHGTTERADRLALVAQITGREVASSKEMTEAEAQQVCDELESRIAEPFPSEEP